MDSINNARRPIIAANWKMYGGRAQADYLVNKIINGVKGIKTDNNIDILICPPAILIPLVLQATDASNILVGGQNCYCATEGAYTGEISPSMLKDFSCQYVILGHSERRQLFAESNELVAKKFSAAHAAGIKPILCVGESQQERAAGDTLPVIAAQLRAVLELVNVDAFADAVIAYEPIWAIGTGLTATPQQAQEVHSFIRGFLAQLNVEIASQVRIIYGGSVKPSNAAELFAQQDIDGGLIGGASLKADEFIAICKHAL